MKICSIKFNNFLKFRGSNSNLNGFGIVILFYSTDACRCNYLDNGEIHWIALKFKILMASCPTDLPVSLHCSSTSEFVIYMLYAKATWIKFKTVVLWLIKQRNPVPVAVFFHLCCRAVWRVNRKLIPILCDTSESKKILVIDRVLHVLMNVVPFDSPFKNQNLALFIC